MASTAVPITPLTAEQIVQRDTERLTITLAKARGDPASVELLAGRLEDSALRTAVAAVSQVADPLALIRLAGRHATDAQVLRAALSRNAP